MLLCRLPLLCGGGSIGGEVDGAAPGMTGDDVDAIADGVGIFESSGPGERVREWEDSKDSGNPERMSCEGTTSVGRAAALDNVVVDVEDEEGSVGSCMRLLVVF
mmetsp:Transcript_31269/g.37819  ORF Transcript_31269/g.37819 Transcript_31269/m.37819 type:complete len:104 (+) Transcript_31269:168-479(+)